MELPTCSTPAVAVKRQKNLTRETSTLISARTAVAGRISKGVGCVKTLHLTGFDGF